MQHEIICRVYKIIDRQVLLIFYFLKEFLDFTNCSVDNIVVWYYISNMLNIL